MHYRGGALELFVGVLDRGFEIRLFRLRVVVLPLQRRKSVLHCLQLRLLAAERPGISRQRFGLAQISDI